jgi:Mrp family chromosome partitioning ATPase
MERIQAAIAKARASRDHRAPGPSGGLRRSAPALPGRRAEAWEALPMHRATAGRLERNRIIANIHSEEGAAFDVLRTRVLKMMQENGWKRLAITSPTAACGKSTVALNLGLSLTRRDDVSAILIEADMRRPSLAQKLGITERYSAATVLRGTAPFGDNACRISERFALTVNLGKVTNPSDFLQAPLVNEVLRGIEEEYAPTVMLFDMPPLLVNDDTIGFLRHVDCAMVVAAAEHTSVKEIDECERELASHTNVLGVVLNKCRFTGRKYGYDYYYS